MAQARSGAAGTPVRRDAAPTDAPKGHGWPPCSPCEARARGPCPVPAARTRTRAPPATRPGHPLSAQAGHLPWEPTARTQRAPESVCAFWARSRRGARPCTRPPPRLSGPRDGQGTKRDGDTGRQSCSPQGPRVRHPASPACDSGRRVCCWGAERTVTPWRDGGLTGTGSDDMGHPRVAGPAAAVRLPRPPSSPASPLTLPAHRTHSHVRGRRWGGAERPGRDGNSGFPQGTRPPQKGPHEKVPETQEKWPAEHVARTSSLPRVREGHWVAPALSASAPAPRWTRGFGDKERQGTGSPLWHRGAEPASPLKT